MKSLSTLLAIGLVAACVVTQAHAAQDKAKPTQQNKMAMCNKEASGKAGDERKKFMKECLSARKDNAQTGKS